MPNSVPNTINTFAKWKKKMVNNASANQKNIMKQRGQDAEALIAAAAEDASIFMPPAAESQGEEEEEKAKAATAARKLKAMKLKASDEAAGAEAAEAARQQLQSDSVIEMFPPELNPKSNPMNQEMDELQMIIDDMYRKFMDDDNQAVPVRKRLLEFLDKGGVDMPRDKFDAAFKHAAAEYKRY